MEKKIKREIFKRIKIELIDRPVNIQRMDIDREAVQDLANSIKKRGLLQPIGVVERGERYKIVFGDRRYLAHELLGMNSIMCRIQEIDDDQIVIDRAMENIQRVDLTPYEESHIYVGLVENAGMNPEQIANMIGKSPGIVQRRMDIMRMPDSFQKALHQKKVGIAVAEVLWSCPDAAKREYFLELAVEHGITLLIARQWVQDFKKSMRENPNSAEPGGRGAMEYEDVPIFRACDVCRDPVEYKDVKELRLCPDCHKAISEARKNKR